MPKSPSPDAVILEALGRLDATDEAADRVLKRALRAYRHLDNAGRAAVALGVHGVRCFEGRLDHLAREVGLSSTPGHRLAIYRVDVQGQDPRPVARGLDLDASISALSRIAAGDVAWPEDPVEALAVRRSLPSWLARRWLAERGPADADALAEAFNVPGPITLRANRLMQSRDALAIRLEAEGMTVRRGRWSQHALHLEGRPDIRGSSAWRQGRFEVQDEGSQLIAAAVQAKPGERILDLCAGAGGKTLALAADMNDRGELVAVEPDAARVLDLKGRVGRLGLGSVRIVDAEASSLGAFLGEMDRVLVDAPCSALGTLRRGPDRRWRISEAEAARFPEMQLDLLRQGARHVRPKGRLVYATCTLLRAENQDVMRDFLDREPAFHPVSPGAWAGLDLGVALNPHQHGTDGFFIAVFARDG